MPKIFISYRRADSRKDAGRIYDRLVETFGKENIFKDVDNIPYGRDFRAVLGAAVNETDVLLAVVGQNWLTTADEQDNRRLENPADFVRIEIQSALHRGDLACLVIPVLVDSASMPAASQLPVELRELAFKNAVTVRDDPDFHRDMERLVRQLQVYDEELAARRIAAEAERQYQLQIEAKAKYEAEERERQHIAEERAQQKAARLKASADETVRLRRAKLRTMATSETRYAPANLENSEQETRPESRQPASSLKTNLLLPEPNISAVQPRPWRKLLKSHYVLGLAGLIGLVIVFVIVSPIIQISKGIQHNADWTPIQRDFDSIPMVQVPAGCFDMGNDPEAYDGSAIGAGNGGHICFNEPFWLDKTEVTNAQFTQFGGVAAFSSHWIDDDHPRENISWFEARDFCMLRGGRLPTEAEWEYAARGPDKLIYTWGNVFNSDNAVNAENSNSQTAAVGSRLSGASWVGALDMDGNVWEWVSTLYQPYPYPTPGSNEERDHWLVSVNTIDTRSYRGGSWYYSSNPLRAAGRFRNLPANTLSDLGFRCMVSVPNS